MENRARILNLKYILPLSLLFMTIYLAADSVAYKMVFLGSALEPGPPFIFPLTYAISDIISEVYGLSLAKKIIWMTLAFQLFYALAVTAIINLPSPKFWHDEPSYQAVFGHILQFVLSGTLATVLSSFTNIYIISKWKVLMKGKYFWVRGLGSSAIGGLVLVGVITVFGYIPRIGLAHALSLFTSIYILEFMYAVILVWPVWALCLLIKKREQLDVYDKKVRFNPFCFD